MESLITSTPSAFVFCLTNRQYTFNNTLLKKIHYLKKETWYKIKTTYQIPTKTAALCGKLLPLCWGHTKVTGNLWAPTGPVGPPRPLPTHHIPGAMHPFPSGVFSTLARTAEELPGPALPPYRALVPTMPPRFPAVITFRKIQPICLRVVTLLCF